MFQAKAAVQAQQAVAQEAQYLAHALQQAQVGSNKKTENKSLMSYRKTKFTTSFSLILILKNHCSRPQVQLTLLRVRINKRFIIITETKQ